MGKRGSLSQSQRMLVDQILSQAMSLEDPESRAALVRDQSGGDGAVVDEVLRLLSFMDDGDLLPEAVSAAHLRGATALENPYAAGETSDHRYRSGATIGVYTVSAHLGEGTFADVYLAEQREPVRRQVALKILKPHIQRSDTVLARFKAERQSLALMNHPGVAKFFDAGTTDRGESFFVMEYIEGHPVDQFCDARSLTIRARLALFAQICDAVQHAHQKGVIHRDLKPSNILVATSDSGEFHPVVIDFGVAKAIGPDLSQQIQFTEMMTLIGTPEYMSPEQARMTSQGIDARSDIYGLGVVLYQVLVGSLPFESSTLRRAGVARMCEIICEVDPPSPSDALAEMDDETAEHVSRCRSIERRVLARELQQELDWIPRKALQKDPDARYRTASELADEIYRYLAGEPLIAGPTTGLYLAGKFVQRNRNVVAVSALFLVVVLSGVIATTGLWLLASQRADSLERVAGFQEKQLSSVDVVKMVSLLRPAILNSARRVAVGDLEEGTDAYEEAVAEVERLHADTDFAGIAARLVDDVVIEPALVALKSDFDDDPLIRARLLQSVADMRVPLALFDGAIGPAREALQTRREILGDDHPDTLASMNAYGVALRESGELEDAKPFIVAALKGRRRVLGAEHPSTLESLNEVGKLDYELQTPFAESEPRLRQAVDVARRVLGPDDPVTVTALLNYGAFLDVHGKSAEAEPYLREVLETRRRTLGPDHIETMRAMQNYGVHLAHADRLDDAAPYLYESLIEFRRWLGRAHPNTLISMSSYAVVLRRQGKLAEAEPFFRESLASARRVLTDDHAYTITIMFNLARLLTQRQAFSQAEPLALECLERSESCFGPTHAETLAAAALLFRIYNEWHREDPDAGHDASAERWRLTWERRQSEAEQDQ